MLIQYVVTKHRREVPDAIAKRLLAIRVATRVVLPGEAADIAPTEKPKRQYKRRDMVAES